MSHGSSQPVAGAAGDGEINDNCSSKHSANKLKQLSAVALMVPYTRSNV